MTDSIISVFTCCCPKPKKHGLTIDGGISGNYQLELCSSCYSKEDKKFVIKEDKLTLHSKIKEKIPISETDGQGRPHSISEQELVDSG